MVKVGILAVFLMLGEKHLDFKLITVMLTIGFSTDVFYQSEEIFFYF